MNNQIIYDEKTPASVHLINVPCIGKIAGMNEYGEIFVLFDDHEPVPARMVSGIKFDLMKKANIDREVLLVFEKGNPSLPIIIALMTDPFEHLSLNPSINHSKDILKVHAQKIEFKADEISLEADEKISFKCTNSNISLFKDGKIVQKGKRILSKAIEMIRIVGGAVRIN